MEQRFSFALKLRKIGKRKALWKMTITFSDGICYHKYWNQRVVCFAERKSSWSKLFFYSGPRTKIKTQCSLLRRKIQYKKVFWSQNAVLIFGAVIRRWKNTEFVVYWEWKRWVKQKTSFLFRWKIQNRWQCRTVFIWQNGTNAAFSM